MHPPLVHLIQRRVQGTVDVLLNLVGQIEFESDHLLSLSRNFVREILSVFHKLMVIFVHRQLTLFQVHEFCKLLLLKV